MNNLGDLDPLDYFPGEEELEDYNWLEEPIFFDKDFADDLNSTAYPQVDFVQNLVEKYAGDEVW